MTNSVDVNCSLPSVDLKITDEKCEFLVFSPSLEFTIHCLATKEKVAFLNELVYICVLT